MKHYNYEEIYLYLDGEMSPMERSLFEDHILVCKECAEKLQRAKALFQGIKLEEENPPVDIASLVMAKIDKKRKLLPVIYGIFILLIALLTVPVFFGLDRAIFFYYIIFDSLNRVYLVSKAGLSYLFSLKIPAWVFVGAGLMLFPVYFALRKIWRNT